MQLKAVGAVAVLGGLLQIVIFMFLCGILAMVWCWLWLMCCLQYDCVVVDTKLCWPFVLQLCGGKLSEGVFVGSFLSMSSTAVVCFRPISWNLWYCCYWWYLRDSKYDLLFTFTFYQVIKFLVERNNSNALHVQVTIGTLIFQVSFLLSFKS